MPKQHPRSARFNAERPIRDSDDEFYVPPSRHAVRVRIPQGAPKETVYAIRQQQHRMLIMQVEGLLEALGTMQIGDLARLVHEEAYQLVKHSSDLVERAEKELNIKYAKRFTKIADRALQIGSTSMLETLEIGRDTIDELLANVPNFPIFPPEKQGLIRQILGKMFGLQED